MGGKSVPLKQLWHQLDKIYGSSSVEQLWTQIKSQVAALLVAAEYEILSRSVAMNSSRNFGGAIGAQAFGLATADNFPRVACQKARPIGFQLLSFEFALNATLQPFLWHVNVKPHFLASRSIAMDAVKSQILADVARILTAGRQVATQVAQALRASDASIGLMCHFCRLSHDICLTENDLSYLLQSRREDLSRGMFEQKIQKEVLSSASAQQSTVFDVSKQHQTAQMHRLLIDMEVFYSRMDSEEGKSRPVNYTLGLGYNRISVVVVDIRHAEARVANAYVLSVFRRERTTRNEALQPHFAGHYAVCSLKQQLLFLGDSTNRGIMYYVLMRLNGTLGEWHKSHGIALHAQRLNGGRTAAGFAYYPQFWLPPNRRPTLARTLNQLIDSMPSLENSERTVLVVGGVQWLNVKQLSSLTSTLKGRRTPPVFRTRERRYSSGGRRRSKIIAKARQASVLGPTSSGPAAGAGSPSACARGRRCAFGLPSLLPPAAVVVVSVEAAEKVARLSLVHKTGAPTCGPLVSDVGKTECRNCLGQRCQLQPHLA
ncbi:hypothetical protein MTO96_010509 [Rhipicephalus appendiculatus]